MAIAALNPYEALGLSNDASLAAIRSAYKKLMLQCHPDKVHDESLREEKAVQFQKVQEAYELLSDPGRKLKYDAEAALAAEKSCSDSRSSSKEEKHRDKKSSRERERRPERSSSSRSYDEHHREKESRESREAEQRERRENREKEHREQRESREREHREREGKEREQREREQREREHRGSPVKEPRERRDSRIHRESRESRESESRVPQEARETRQRRGSRESTDGQETKPQEKEAESDPEIVEVDLNKPAPSLAPKHKPQPPTADALKSHHMKYEEEKAKEEARLKKARATWTMSEIGEDKPRPAPLGRRSSTKPTPEELVADKQKSDKGDECEQARLKEQRDRERAREKVRMTTLPEQERKRAEAVAASGRRGSDKERNRSGSLKDEDATPVRERKGSRSSPIRKDSASPTRAPLDASGRPIRTPCGSAPPPSASSFGGFMSTSPTRRHSVSNPGPNNLKGRFNRPEDSGYSSPIHSGPISVDPAFMRHKPEGVERSSGYAMYDFDIVPDDLEARGMGQRRKTTSHHPAESASYVSERSPHMSYADFGQSVPVSPGSANPGYPYQSPMGYFPASPYGIPSTQYPPHVPQTAHSVVYSSSPPLSRSHRHHSHQHSGSPNHSPKMTADGFPSNKSSASTVGTGHSSHSGYHHHSSSHHYAHSSHSSARSDVPYFTPPTLQRGHTMPTM